jgi:DNA polymerase III delta subunit
VTEYTYFNFLRENPERILEKPACLIYGFNEFLGDRIIKKYCQHFLEEKNDFNFKRYFFDKYDKSNWQEVIAELKSSTFFVQSKKVITAVIRDAQALVLKKEEKALIEEYIKNPNNNSIFIIHLSLNLLKDDYNNLKRSKLKTLIGIFKKPGSITINLDKLYERDVASYIREELKKDGLSITQNAINRIFEIMGGDFAAVIHQLPKFQIYNAAEKKIDSMDVEEILTGMQAHSIWDLVEAVEQEDTKKYISILNYLLLHGYKPVFIIGTLISHYNKIYIAKTLLQKRYPAQEIGAKLNQPSFRLTKFINSVRKFSQNRLAKILDIIYKIDYESKTGGENMAKLNLQNFIFRIKLLKNV